MQVPNFVKVNLNERTFTVQSDDSRNAEKSFIFYLDAEEPTNKVSDPNPFSFVLQIVSSEVIKTKQLEIGDTTPALIPLQSIYSTNEQFGSGRYQIKKVKLGSAYKFLEFDTSQKTFVINREELGDQFNGQYIVTLTLVDERGWEHELQVPIVVSLTSEDKKTAELVESLKPNLQDFANEQVASKIVSKQELLF